MSQPTQGNPKPGAPAPDAGAEPAESAPTEPSVSGGASLSSGGRPRTDTMLIHGVSEDGESFAVLRAREDRLEAGIVRKVKDGESLHGELLRLTPRPESPLLCDVQVEYAPPSAVTAASKYAAESAAADGPHAPKLAAQKLQHGGPAQVATSSYRANWDAIWSKPAKVNQPN